LIGQSLTYVVFLSPQYQYIMEGCNIGHCRSLKRSVFDVRTVQRVDKRHLDLASTR